MQEFDWEAAVREIDSACQGASASTSSRVGAATLVPDQTARETRSSKPGGPAWGHRQSTLDSFLGACGKPRGVVYGSGHCPPRTDADGGDHPGGDQMAAVSIDLDAARTWIYPGWGPYLVFLFRSLSC